MSSSTNALLRLQTHILKSTRDDMVQYVGQFCTQYQFCAQPLKQRRCILEGDELIILSAD